MADALSALRTLEHDLREIFGGRLQSLLHYGVRAYQASEAHHHGPHEPALAHALAVTESLTPDDLRACAKRISAWHDDGIATPLIVPRAELVRSLDAFPFGRIQRHHRGSRCHRGNEPVRGSARRTI
jgi:hypothetical protein